MTTVYFASIKTFLLRKKDRKVHQISSSSLMHMQLTILRGAIHQGATVSVLRVNSDTDLSMKRGSNCAGTPCNLCCPWARICGAMAIWFLIISSCLCLSSAREERSTTGHREAGLATIPETCTDCESWRLQQVTIH